MRVMLEALLKALQRKGHLATQSSGRWLWCICYALKAHVCVVRICLCTVLGFDPSALPVECSIQSRGEVSPGVVLM